MTTLITVKRSVSMGHRLQSYKGICVNPHGHNIKVEVTVRSYPGGFIDFKEVDALLWSIIEPMDHSMVLEQDDPLLAKLEELSEYKVMMLKVEPTTENIASYVFDQMTKRTNHIVDSVTVHETDKYSATVRLYP